jgi:hypothetical protein
MNKKTALVAVILLVPTLAQGWSSSFKAPKILISNFFVDQRAQKLIDEDNTSQTNAFNQVYKPWLFTASRASFAVSGTSAVVAGTAKYCPQLHNDKVVYAAAATSVLSLISGMIFNSLAHKNFNAAENNIIISQQAALEALRKSQSPKPVTGSGDINLGSVPKVSSRDSLNKSNPSSASSSASNLQVLVSSVNVVNHADSDTSNPFVVDSQNAVNSNSSSRSNSNTDLQLSLVDSRYGEAQ